MFWKKRRAPIPAQAYDPQKVRPVIRCSICTGEEVAGFRELETGRFHDVQLLSGPKDLQKFMQRYGIDSVPPKEY